MTSTKWKYQALASNPTWCTLLSWQAASRHRETVRKAVPIKTCRPWNPVARKNVEPDAPSARLSQVD